MTTPPVFPRALAALGRPAALAVCARCRRDQPVGPWPPPACVYCAGPLVRLRWQAHTPPGVPVTVAAPPAPSPPYPGPPSYAGRPPRWGFPASAWRPAEITPAGGLLGHSGSVVPAGRLARSFRLAAVASVLLAGVSVSAAAAETWRFRLLLTGRTQVLPGSTVRAGNALVAATGWLALLAAAVLAVLAVPALIRAPAVFAARHGWAPARPPAAVAGRLLVPGVNLWGAGAVVAEISSLAVLPPADSGPAPARLRPTPTALAWWVLWVVGGAFAVATLIRGFARSEQAVADTVELHIAVDLAAAALAVLTAVLFIRFRRALEPGPDPLAGWSVAAPGPTSNRGRDSSSPSD